MNGKRENENHIRMRGRLCVLAAVLLFSTGGFLIKSVPWGGIAIVGGRSMIGAVVQLLYLKLTGRRLVCNLPTLAGALFVAGDFLIYVTAAKLTTAANAVMLENTAPIFVILICWALYGKCPTRLDMLACAAVFLGILLFFIDSLSAGNLTGNLLALCSAVCYAGIMLLRTIEGCDSGSALSLGFLISGLVGLPWTLTAGEYSVSILLAILVLGVFQGGVAYIFFELGIRDTPPVETSFLCTLEPLLNALMVAVICGEWMTPLSTVGFVIVFAAISAYSVLSSRKETAS